MDWINPLRSLSPLSEHPSVSSASSPLSSALSDDQLAALELEVELDNFGKRHYRASRVLSSFYGHLDHDGKCVLAADIQQYKNDDKKLVLLANHLIDAILKPFKLAGCWPRSVTSPLADDADDAIDLAMIEMESASRNEQESLKRDCLRRDGHRCVFTGRIDMHSYERAALEIPPNPEVDKTQCAHIIPFALGDFDESNAAQTRNKAIIWFALYRYFPALQSKIEAASINQRANAVTLTLSAHASFDDFGIVLWPCGINKYKATCSEAVMHSSTTPKGGSLVITLDSHDDNVPMPDPEFFKVHYIAAQILQVSGIGQEMDRIKAKADGYHDYLHPAGLTPIGSILSKRLLTSVQSDNEGDQEHKSMRRSQDSKVGDGINDGSGDLTPTGPRLALRFSKGVRTDNGG